MVEGGDNLGLNGLHQKGFLAMNFGLFKQAFKMWAHLEVLDPTGISLDDSLKNYASLALGKVLNPVEEPFIVLKGFL